VEPIERIGDESVTETEITNTSNDGALAEDASATIASTVSPRTIPILLLKKTKMVMAMPRFLFLQ